MNSNRYLSVFTLTMINICAMTSLRSLPLAASYGFSILPIYLFAALCFLIPSALVSAELATTFSDKGGVFAWVREAFGVKWGFLAIWMQFIANVTWYPMALSFAAAAIAFGINPTLASNKTYMTLMILGTFWMATFLNLKGLKISGWISSLGAILGTLIPGLFIIILGFCWWYFNPTTQVITSWSHLIPQMNLKNLVFVSGIIFSFAGMEMSAVHAGQLKNPATGYPKATFISALVLVLILVMGALSMALVIPREKVQLAQGVLDALSAFFTHFHLIWMIKPLALLISFGVISQISTWLLGAIKGMHHVAEQNLLPSGYKKLNSKGMPYVLILSQASLVTILTLLFLIMPNTNSAFWILGALTTQLYLVMYMLLFIAAIYLKFKRFEQKRVFAVFGGKVGLTTVAGVGFITSFLIFFLNFIPPDLIDVGNLFFYESLLVIGLTLFSIIPFVYIQQREKRGQLQAA